MSERLTDRPSHCHPGLRDLTADCGVDRVRGALEESIEVITAQHMRCPVGELVIGRPCQDYRQIRIDFNVKGQYS
jgi:hypothetical protein